ncbi:MULTISPECIES: hypothetical protein [Vibrio]|uniref:hypothetical protein n=1 Tax=Vibrio TaxID=662 RepID=UPI0013FC3DA3|nr:MULTISPECIES: hypothetical protein [Vibrio]NAX16471.1 hypothetical protein [Vibrio sp. V22_P2S10T140]
MTIDIVKRAAAALKNNKKSDAYELSSALKSKVLARKMTSKEINANYSKAKG